MWAMMNPEVEVLDWTIEDEREHANEYLKKDKIILSYYYKHNKKVPKQVRKMVKEDYMYYDKLRNRYYVEDEFGKKTYSHPKHTTPTIVEQKDLEF